MGVACARQVAGDASGQLGGPALGRLNRDAGGAQLLSSYDVFMEGAFADGADVAALLKAAGAKLLSRAPVTGGTTNGRTVVVLLDDGVHSQPGDVQQLPVLRCIADHYRAPSLRLDVCMACDGCMLRAGAGRRADRKSPAGGSHAYPAGTLRLPLTWLMDSASAHVVLSPSQYTVA